MGSPVSGTAAEDQVATLRRYKFVAGAFLAGAAVIWGLSHIVPLPPDVVGYIRAGAEAGMIGGLADWFAVTALFRRPLGLPIPHTNLIPANQDRIAEGVARYIDGEFLRREMLVGQIRRFDIADRLAGTLKSVDDRRRIVEGIMHFLPRVLDTRGDPAVRAAIVEAARSGLSDIDLRPAVATLLRRVVEGDDLAILIRDGCEALRRLLESRRTELRGMVSARTPWFVPSAIDGRVAEILVRGFSDLLEQLKDPESEKGHALRRWLRDLPELVERSEGVGERLADLMQRAAHDQEIVNVASGLWIDVKRMLLDDIRAPQSKTRDALDAVVMSLADQLDSVSLRREVNAAVEAFLAENVPEWRMEIRRFIVETLSRQRPDQFARRIELQVGKDLQFIRINGTVFGALVGVAIHVANGLF